MKLSFEQHLLICLAEECAELQQAISKALRFGVNDSHTDSPPAERMLIEFNDILAIAKMLNGREGISLYADPKLQEKKAVRTASYMRYSIEKGNLEQDGN